MPNPARTNPPLYYLSLWGPYHAASGGTILDQLYLMRAAGLVFLLMTVTATWLLIGELAGRKPLLQLAGAATVGLQPMEVFISATINPDGLLYAATAVLLWLGVRVLNRGLTPASGAALGAALAVAILAKGTAYAFVPAGALALAVGLFRLRGGRSRLRSLVPAAMAIGLPVLSWLVYARLSERPAVNQVGTGGTFADFELPGPVGYLWQFYLPKLPVGVPLPETFPDLPAYDYFLQGAWAKFGWLEVTFPPGVYVVLGLFTAVILGGGLLALIRRGWRRETATIAFLLLAALGLLGGLHATEYRIMSDQATPLIQGRYLLPLLPLFGVAAAATVALFSGKRRIAGAAVLIGGLVALQILSLGMVLERFYV